MTLGRGVLAELKPIEYFMLAFARRHADAFPDDPLDAHSPFPKAFNVAQEIMGVVVDHVIRQTPLPEPLASLSGVDELVREVEARHIWAAIPESRRWNGVVALSDLFLTEGIVGPEDTYFDQRFIDYLAAQPVDLAQIHWRKFEQLAAEYFRRVGYRVELGPGRDDGGVDILASRQDEVVGPTLVVVQCRRYGETNPVGVEAVRAFWATVGDTAATRGLIATTSRLTQGARDYCDARRYRLSSADGTRVREWLKAMASPTVSGRPD